MNIPTRDLTVKEIKPNKEMAKVMKMEFTHSAS